MKKLFIKLICLVLSLACIFTATACGEEGDGTGTGTGSGAGNDTNAYQIKEWGNMDGLHMYNKTPVDGKWIVDNGTTEYKLVLPESSHSRIVLARTDFQEIFKKATGVSIQYVLEDQVKDTWTAEDKYIILGCDEIEQKAGLDMNQDLPEGKSINLDGFRILTEGNSIFVMSFDEEGTLWGTYELLTQLVDYEIYWVYYYEVTEMDSVPFYDFDIADNPDFETRIGPWGAVYAANRKTEASRMRFVLQHQDVYVGKVRFHNTLDYLPPETYMNDNSGGVERYKWYAQYAANPVSLINVFQLCYTAKGDPVAYEAMVNAMVDACVAELKENTTSPVITITQEDNTKYCSCNACQAGNRKYGQNLSGNMWKFHLDCVERINNWLDANQPGRKDTLLIAMYAYQTYQQAPAYADDNGVWHPYGEEVNGFNEDRNIKNAAIQFAISSADYVHGIFREDYNKSVSTAISGWKVCCPNVGAWLYQTDFHDYMIPTDRFCFQQNYKMLVDFGTKWIFDQGQQGNENSTGFNDYKLYLNMKLQWNVNLDVDTLKQKYFNAMYGPASEVMQKYYDHLRIHFQFLAATDIDGRLAQVENYPYQVVKQWLDYCEEAYEILDQALATGEIDETYYNLCKDHVITESVGPRYCIIKWHSGTVSPEKLKVMKSTLKEDVLRLGFTEWSQHEDINDIMKDW